MMSGKKECIKLSGRMTALAALVTPGHRLADVGCDHGYIPIHLCAEAIIPSAIAMDVNPGPLARAQEHIAAHGLQERIQTRLSDGLKELGENEADTVLIAGMGGFLMRRILCEEGAVPESVSELVLQPQSDIVEIRRCMREIGFVIDDEDMVEEDGKFYPMMKARRRASESIGESGMPGAPASGCERRMRGESESEGEQYTLRKMESDGQTGLDKLCGDMFGPVLLRKHHPVLRRWLERELKITEAILSRLDAENAGGAGENSREEAVLLHRNAEGADRERNGKLAVRKRELTERRELMRYALEAYLCRL